MSLVKPSYQLAFDLNLDDPVEDAQQGWVSPEEAALRETEARTHFESGEKPEWYEEYENLVYGGWPFRVAMYIAWASMPTHKQYPRTLNELADLMGLKSPRAIHTWKARNKAIRDQIHIMQAAPFFKARADVIAASIQTASEPGYKNTPERRLVYQLLGDLEEDVNIKVAGAKNDLSQMTDAELAELEVGLKREGAERGLQALEEADDE